MAEAIAIGLILTGLAAGLGLLIKKVAGVPCNYCHNMRMTEFGKLPIAKRMALLAYFKEREGRAPDRAGVFVCEECKLVYDDFSGEKRSRDIDGGRGGNRTFCKVCNEMIFGCDPQRGRAQCRACQTVYSWEEYGDTGLRIFMPPEGAKILARCRDLYGIG